MERYQEAIEKYKIPIGLSLVGIVLIIGGIFSSHLSQKSKTFPKESVIAPQLTMITVDVSGAVLTPGVYQLSSDARIEDAIQKAGGFSDQANSEYVSKYLNMAQKITDGVKIYVPSKGDPAPVGAGQSQVVGAKTSSAININTASQDELNVLVGIGDVTSGKIISGRPYQKIEDLLDKKIVSKAVFEKIKDQIVVY